MNRLFLFFTLLCLSLQAQEEGQGIILTTKRIILPKYPTAFNPTLLKTEEGFLMLFRYCPDFIANEWNSYIGLVLLNESFDPISAPQLLNTRWSESKIQSQSEDPRIFSYRGRNFVIFNDNMELQRPSTWQRRDMYLMEFLQSEGHFYLSSPIKLTHEGKYNTQWWQKNWIPFEWNQTLFLIYSINPHDILYPNLINGQCHTVYETKTEFPWKWGTPRGSTPALLVDGEYLTFFHSGIYMASEASWDVELWHYFMGAYTFSAEPPFEIIKITPAPLIADGFYTKSYRPKRVIFPSGYVVAEPYIYVSYGKDDEELWVATLDKKALFKFLKPVK
ncbi:MAG: hypothetical protein KGJ02_06125 [Verrucomicrobiota bacterium]|nr:hypothetical protein [Verrucomicrobiota bacterium]